MNMRKSIPEVFSDDIKRSCNANHFVNSGIMAYKKSILNATKSHHIL